MLRFGIKLWVYQLGKKGKHITCSNKGGNWWEILMFSWPHNLRVGTGSTCISGWYQILNARSRWLHLKQRLILESMNWVFVWDFSFFFTTYWCCNLNGTIRCSMLLLSRWVLYPPNLGRIDLILKAQTGRNHKRCRNFLLKKFRIVRIFKINIYSQNSSPRPLGGNKHVLN